MNYLKNWKVEVNCGNKLCDILVLFSFSYYHFLTIIAKDTQFHFGYLIEMKSLDFILNDFYVTKNSHIIATYTFHKSIII